MVPHQWNFFVKKNLNFRSRITTTACTTTSRSGTEGTRRPPSSAASADTRCRKILSQHPIRYTSGVDFIKSWAHRVKSYSQLLRCKIWGTAWGINGWSYLYDLHLTPMFYFSKSFNGGIMGTTYLGMRTYLPYIQVNMSPC